MKNIKQNPKAIELHKVCMECIDALVKSGRDNDDALIEVSSFVIHNKTVSDDLLIPLLKVEYLKESIESVSEEMIQKIIG